MKNVKRYPLEKDTFTKTRPLETKAQVPWVWTLDSLIADLTRQQYSHRENKAKKNKEKDNHNYLEFGQTNC